MSQKLIILLLLFAYFQTQAQSVSVNFNTSSTLDADQNFGYNPGGLMYFHNLTDCTNNTDSSYFNRLGCNFTTCVNEDLLDYLEVMPGNVIRFPSGTYSQFYHFGNLINNCSTSKTGAGYNLLETRWFPNTFPPNGNIWNNNHERNIIFDFVDLIKGIEERTGEQYKVIFVANFLTHWFDSNNTITNCNFNIPKRAIADGDLVNNGQFNAKYEENVAAIQFLLDHQIDVAGIELGNELYFKVFTDSTKTILNCINFDLDISEYRDVATAYSQNLSNHSDTRLNNIPLAVPAGNKATFQDWNNGLLAAITADSTVYDAFVIHHYHKHGSGGLLDEYAASGEFVAQLQQFNLDYNPSGKPFWITEFNDDNSSASNNLRMSASLLALIHNLKNYNQDPAQSNQIEFMTAHNLGAKNQNGLAILDMQYRVNDNGTEYIHPNNTFYPLYLQASLGSFKEPADLSITYNGITPDEITLRPYTLDGSLDFGLVYANPTAQAVTLDLANSLHQNQVWLNQIDTAQMELKYYYAASETDDLLGLGGVATDTSITAATTVVGGPAILPAYSVGVLRLPRGPVGAEASRTSEESWSFDLFPNPGTGMFQFRADFVAPGPIKIQVWNTAGQMVLALERSSKAGSQGVEIDLRDQSGGLYFVVASCKSWRQTQRLVKF